MSGKTITIHIPIELAEKYIEVAELINAEMESNVEAIRSMETEIDKKHLNEGCDQILAQLKILSGIAEHIKSAMILSDDDQLKKEIERLTKPKEGIDDHNTV